MPISSLRQAAVRIRPLHIGRFFSIQRKPAPCQFQIITWPPGIKTLDSQGDVIDHQPLKTASFFTRTPVIRSANSIAENSNLFKKSLLNPESENLYQQAQNKFRQAQMFFRQSNLAEADKTIQEAIKHAKQIDLVGPPLQAILLPYYNLRNQIQNSIENRAEASRTNHC